MVKCIRLKLFLVIFLILAILPLNSMNIIAFESEQYFHNAQTLNALGLFKGTSLGYELTRTSTRAEAAVMLVRLLGAEELALEQEGLYQHPFLDVADWANPYIEYLYSRGLTQGTSSTTYGSNNNITANQYITMILRALDYNDRDGLYQWDKAIDYAVTVGLIDEQNYALLQPVANTSLYRDEMAGLSYKSLFTMKRDTQTQLISSLFDRQAISEEKLAEAMLLDPNLIEFYNSKINMSEDEELRGVWITYIELQSYMKNATGEEFSITISEVFQKIKHLGLNTVMVQVRPFSDALYPSDYFPWSYVITGEEGVEPSYDPLAIMVEKAHEQGLKIQAWINPYRIRSEGSKIELSSGHLANQWLKDGSNRVIQYKGAGIFYNPAYQEVRELIINGVSEIIENYPVDGIHFDDYFYPSRSLLYDADAYNQYVNDGGLLSQEDWRRENINLLIKGVYSTIKSNHPEVQFGVSPQGSFEGNYDQQFIDVVEWVTHTGYIDYICPQIYYGYDHLKYPYYQVLEEWNEIITNESIKLYVGLGAYKIGREDIWAGTYGRTEWMTSEKLIQRMVVDGREMSQYRGFMLYRYDYLFDQEEPYSEQMAEEIEALKNILVLEESVD